MPLNAAEITDKWARNTTGSTQSMTDGVNAVQVSPMQKAAEAEDRMLAGVQRAVTSGKWREGLMSVTLQDWKTAMIEKGIPRIAQGVNKAKPKFQRFIGNLMNHIANIRAQLDTMPRGDLETNLQRMNFNARQMAQFRNQ